MPGRRVERRRRRKEEEKEEEREEKRIEGNKGKGSVALRWRCDRGRWAARGARGGGVRSATLVEE